MQEKIISCSHCLCFLQPRAQHIMKAVVTSTNQELWLLGGSEMSVGQGYNYFNDVWVSPDGKWSELRPHLSSHLAVAAPFLTSGGGRTFPHIWRWPHLSSHLAVAAPLSHLAVAVPLSHLAVAASFLTSVFTPTNLCGPIPVGQSRWINP